jgi:hypothetical protein
MPFSFPASPSVGATSQQNGREYRYAGNNVWELVGGGSGSIVTAATVSAFPATGSAAGVIYVATDTARAYIWAGAYIEVGASGGSSGSDSRWDSFLPAAPTGVTAMPGSSQAGVSWTAPSGSHIPPMTDYTLQYSSNSGSTWTSVSRAASSATKATVTGLSDGTSYVFRVAGINGVGSGGFSTASSAVSPASLVTSGLHLHLDASDASTLFDATSGGNAVSANGTVARWEDKSGNARHATQGTAGSRPTLSVNSSGQRVVRFDGLATFLRTATTFSDSSDFSLFFTSPFGFGRGIGDGWSVQFGSGVVAGGQYVPAPAAQTLGISSYIWRNGVSLGALSNGAMVYTQTGASGLRNSSEAWNIGRQAGETQFTQIDARELVIYDRALSNSEVLSVVNYLAVKWSTF